MRINVREIIGGRRLTQEKVELDISDIVRDNPGVSKASRAHALVDAYGEDDIAVVTGQLTCDLELVCSRCLAAFDHPFQTRVEEVFALERPGEDAEEDPEDDDRMIHYVKSDVVDLDPILLENVIVVLPEFPLCREDCRGLCPECGTDRNVNDCGCRTERIDPRWSALKELFDK